MSARDLHCGDDRRAPHPPAASSRRSASTSPARRRIAGVATNASGSLSICPIRASTKLGECSNASPWKLITRSGSWSSVSASAQRSVPLRHSGEVMITPALTPGRRHGDPLIVGGDEYSRNAAHPASGLDASLDQGIGDAGRAFRATQRLSRITRRFVPCRNDDERNASKRRAVVDMEHSNRRLESVDHEERGDLVLLEQSQSIVDQSVRKRRLG